MLTERIKDDIIVNNRHGLHARPAALFVRIASKYDSAVKLERGDESVDGKSIISILSLGVNKGAKVRLIVAGEDARDAFSELKEFLINDDD